MVVADTVVGDGLFDEVVGVVVDISAVVAAFGLLHRAAALCVRIGRAPLAFQGGSLAGVGTETNRDGGIDRIDQYLTDAGLDTSGSKSVAALAAVVTDHAIGAGLGARTPGLPVVDFAVRGAWAIGAVTDLTLLGALVFAVGVESTVRGLDVGAGSRVLASAAGLGASRPVQPIAVDAVSGACMGVAVLSFERMGAVLTSGCRRKELASASLCTCATRLGARLPRVPGFDLAVRRASECVALASVSCGGAFQAAVAGRSHNAFAGLAANAACQGTFNPGIPSTNLAVSGAFVGVALLGIGRFATSHTAVLGFSGDAGTSLVARFT